MGEIMKKTEEYRLDTEEHAQEFINKAKADANENGYELVSYQATHKIKKDDDYYVVKLVKQW